MPLLSPEKLRGLIWIKVSYLLALAAAIGAGFLAESWGWQDLWMILASATTAGTLVIFVFSFVFKNSSFYDPYWSLMPLYAAVWLFIFHGEAGLTERQMVLLVPIILYGARLTFNWWRGWTGLHHEDWRYEDLQEQHGKNYWLVSFSGIHFFPTALTFLGSVPMIVIMANPAPLGALDVVGGLLILLGVILEGTADNQLRSFRLSNSDPERILDTGLWKYSRHPNYFGEMLVWWGIAIMGFASMPDSIWNWVGTAAISSLFIFISVPMIDDRMLAKRPAYAERKKKVSALVPMPPKS
jgi:steroid 5-alpha reductase family enzyme